MNRFRFTLPREKHKHYTHLHVNVCILCTPSDFKRPPTLENYASFGNVVRKTAVEAALLYYIIIIRYQRKRLYRLNLKNTLFTEHDFV